jgi:predicted nucleotidyltransferase
MDTVVQIEDKLRAVKPYLQKEFGVSQIGYFGSFAKGDQHAASDLDVLVAFNKKVGWKFFDLKDYLESLLNRKVDLVTERSLRKQWKQAILQEVRYL